MDLWDLFTLWETKTMETGRKFWNLEYEESVQGRITTAWKNQAEMEG
jgi:hypothetical protein